jgi:hypothetical protein
MSEPENEGEKAPESTEAEPPKSAEPESSEEVEPSEPSEPSEPPAASEPGALITPGLNREVVRVEAERKRDRVIGLSILIVAFAIGLGISLWAKKKSRPEVAEPPGPPTTGGIVGFPTNVDTLKSLNGARAVTRRRLLRNVTIEGVRSDGSIDLTEGPGRARYVFQSAEGEGAQPPREPGSLPRRHYCGKQTVHLRSEGFVADPDITDYPCAPAHTDALPEPRCSLSEVWAHAIRAGAPRNRMARIEYFRSRSGPAWKFELPGTPHKYALYGDCGRELSEAEAAVIPY